MLFIHWLRDGCIKPLIPKDIKYTWIMILWHGKKLSLIQVASIKLIFVSLIKQKDGVKLVEGYRYFSPLCLFLLENIKILCKIVIYPFIQGSLKLLNFILNHACFWSWLFSFKIFFCVVPSVIQCCWSWVLFYFSPNGIFIFRVEMHSFLDS